MKKLIIIFIILCLFAFLFYIYQYYGYGKYINLGKDAPLPTKLDPEVAKSIDLIVKRANQKGIIIEITEGLRTAERQNELYQQGRTTEGNIVTYAKAGESYHNYGLAVDFVVINKDGNPTWDYSYDGNSNGKSDWEDVAYIAKELGFKWGGDWINFKDYPHLQMTYGLSIHQLQMGLRPKHD